MIIQHATREDWLRERRSGIGGSDAPAVLGISSYSCPLRVWADRVSPHDEIDPPPVPGTPMSIGLRLERGIGEEIAAIAGYVIEPVKADKAFACSVVLDSVPYMRSTPDFFVRDRDGRRGILQIKNVDIGLADEWRDGASPDEYVVQTQHELLTCQEEPEPPEFVTLGAMIGGNRPVMRTWALDEEFAAYWLDEAAKFWRCVETRKPPATVAGPGARRAALSLYRRRLREASVMLAGPEWEALARRRMEISEIVKALEAEAEEIDARALLALGAASRGEVEGIGRIQVNSVEETHVPAHTKAPYSYARWYKPAKGKTRR